MLGKVGSNLKWISARGQARLVAVVSGPVLLSALWAFSSVARVDLLRCLVSPANV